MQIRSVDFASPVAVRRHASRISLVLGLVIAAPAQAQSSSETPAFFSGQGLLEICERPNGGQCSMYVAGVVDGFFYLDRNASDPRFCRAEINNVQAARIVTQRLRSSPTLRGIAAAAAVRIALRNKLGCETDSP